jgi:rhomboid protease GluP
VSDKTVILGPDPAFGRALAAARQAPATVVFLATCVVVFVLAERHGSTEDVETLIRFGATERGHVWAGEVWRLVTSAFLHIGLIHLAWNVLGMFGWCTPIERALGTWRFVVLYLGSAIAASATSLLVHDGVSAGASGAGFGMVGAWLTLDFRRLGSWRAFAADARVRRTAGMAVLWTLVLLGSNVDHAGHAGGLVAGVALTWALSTRPEAPLAARRWAWAVAAMVVVVPAALSAVPRTGERSAVLALELEVGRALEHGDVDAAERVLARAAEKGHRSVYLEFARAYVLQERGDLEGAARGYDALARSDDPEVRRNASGASKKILAVRLDSGLGMARDPARARKLLEEVCSEGDVEVCHWLEEHPPR